MRFYRSAYIFGMLLLCSCMSFRAVSQVKYELFGLRDLTNYWEINLSVGANNFLGDLGGTKGKGQDFLKDYTFETNRYLAGLSGTYNISNWLATDIGFNFGKIYGADSLIENTGDFERWRYYRNLSFKSNVFEAYGGFTIYPIILLKHKKIELYRFNPYIQTGIGVFHFNPTAELDGEKIYLQPLNLEGQGFDEYPDRKPYNRTKLYIPLNLGIKYYFNNRWGLAIGAMSRFTFTDYIDDISTTYIDPALFYKYYSPEQASIAERLYSRSLTPWKVKPDIPKADHTDNDSYVTFYLKLSIRLDKRLYIYYPRL